MRVSSWFLMSSEVQRRRLLRLPTALRNRHLFRFGLVYPIQGPAPSPKAILVIVIRLSNVVPT